MAFTITGSYEITGEPDDNAAAEHDPHRHPWVRFDDVEDLIDGRRGGGERCGQSADK